jgi:hypothetical protein
LLVISAKWIRMDRSMGVYENKIGAGDYAKEAALA